MNCLLSVCIPTYNRVEKLRRCIESVFPLLKTGDVEICVSDNASVDDTPRLLKSYASKSRVFRYICRSQNDGIDANMLAVARMSDGSYIYWLGDDDVLVLEQMVNVLNFLKTNECDLLIAPLFLKESQRQYSDAVHFFSDYGCVGENANMHFSTIVVKKNAIMSEGVQRYSGTYHLYAGSVIDYLCQKDAEGGCKVRIWERPICRIAKSGKTWSNDAVSVFYQKIPQWWHLLPSLIRSDPSCKRAYRRYLLMVTNSMWCFKNFSWHFVPDCPIISLIGLFRRILLMGRVGSFRRHGIKYKLYKVGRYRIVRKSVRARIKKGK